MRKYVIDNILFEGSIDWLECAGIPLHDDYIITIDNIDNSYIFGTEYYFHFSVFTPDDSKYIGTHVVRLPEYVDFMILSDYWDSSKDEFFYNSNLQKTVHRFHNMERYLQPPFYKTEIEKNEFIVKEEMNWAKGIRYFMAYANPDKKLKVARSGKPEDTVLIVAFDAITLKELAIMTYGEIENASQFWKFE